MRPFLSNILTTEDKKSVSTFDETKSTNSVKVIEVKEVSEKKSQKVLEEETKNNEINNFGDQSNNDDKHKEEDRNDNLENIPEPGDILSLEEILNRELGKFSTAGVCWHLSREKNRTLCMFFVRYPSDAQLSKLPFLNF